ncbi:retinoic acid-induced protein 2 [Seriola lalandi dorsalis]|uniref:Retinoic acid induced 2 n=1 Tax=Seriola lalandi dorsalis TaxID=1841481 RepID=A0A3B4XK08_SERLL|nr:retinoic acid-induced protein 2 [Seriola lalandi dorsalis]XP_023284461.1 retinoic acid-induced protein 2 [Seriola lalandi dorsalis]XP_056234627.1 retinoic acid-induced protein 2 [Seriola aureovittata]XP_056234628.1 retinoic acid-induced protein 2 [Seriola aureovittata]
MEGSDDVTQPQTDVCSSEVRGSEITSKVEDGATPVIPADSCDSSTTGLSKGGLSNLVEPPAPSVVTPTAESPGGVSLKVATTVLHPVCLGESPLMLPIHLQMAGAAGPQLGQMGAAPYLITSQSPVSLPLVLDQQVIQHMSPSVIPQTTNCPQLPLQNNVLCQNPLTFGLPPPVDQKSVGQTQEANLLSLLQNPAFAAILQDLFPSQAGSSTCQSPGSNFFPLPPLTPPYTSPLAPLVPPATLLVPYPVIIPLPVPLPVPLPILIPVPQTEDSKGSMPNPVCTVSKSTQTSPKDTTSPSLSSSKCLPLFQPQNVSPSSLPPDEGQALDLSVRACPVEPKQEYPSLQQDSVLDLSVPGVRKKCVQSCSSSSSPGRDRDSAFQSSQDTSGTSLSLGVECSQSLDSKLLGSLASLEFSRQHKWVVDSNAGGSSSVGQDASLSGPGNLEIVSTSQTAKVIVSVKDAIPAILCGKIKGLSGVSTKNFSIKRDGSQGASLQQLYRVPSASQGEQHDPNDPLKKVPKNRAIKLKKVSSQEIHFLPIKKQRLAALLPRK